jgi:hypothetical protein
METCIPGPAERARDAEQLRRFRTGFYRCLTGWAGRGVRAVRRSLVRAGAGRLGACAESGADLPP